MTGSTVSATIEELDAMAPDSTYDRCGAHLIVRVLAWRLRDWLCKRRAVAVVTVVCQLDGAEVSPICRRHLSYLRRHQSALKCLHCGRPASVSGGPR